MKYLIQIGKNAKVAQTQLKNISDKKINYVLSTYKKLLIKNKKKILKKNAKDIKFCQRKSMVDRLMLTEQRLNSIIKSIQEIIKFKSPINRVLEKWKRSNGLTINKVSIPIGVIGVIYESRPNVTCDVAALCLKSGNVVILRGGSEAYNSNKILSDLFRQALKKNSVNQNCVQFVASKNRKMVDYILSKMKNYIDVIVPRGGRSLVQKVQALSNVHVIGHLEGICHVYVDKKADLNKAIKVVNNSKMRRTSICGAAETLLIHESILKTKGIKIINSLQNLGCEIIADQKVNRVFKNKLKAAKLKDWSTEYLDKKISVRAVKNVDEAINHILNFGTMHTDCIITEDAKTAQNFKDSVNSSIVMHNASTQFADGGEFGFGGEIGISTNKLPPRGPVGINQLTSYKYIVVGKGTVRS